MAKPRVERAPKFDMAAVDYADMQPFLLHYNETDNKGRHLHWSLLKWRVPPKDAKKI